MRVVDLVLEPATGFADFYSDEFDGEVRRAALLLDDADLARDVVQDAFVGILERWDPIEEPGPYLHRMVVNGCRDAGRRRGARRRAIQRLSTPPLLPANDEPLWDILQELPFNQRAAVVLRFWGGLTEVEIADQLECATGSIGPWINRALSKMRRALK
jgi:RNA polymerase sigma factor (sigma-70 family)